MSKSAVIDKIVQAIACAEADLKGVLERNEQEITDGVPPSVDVHAIEDVETTLEELAEAKELVMGLESLALARTEDVPDTDPSLDSFKDTVVFSDIYAAIEPADPIGDWSSEERRIALYAYQQPTASVRSVITAMGLFPEDWTGAEIERARVKLQLKS